MKKLKILFLIILFFSFYFIINIKASTNNNNILIKSDKILIPENFSYNLEINNLSRNEKIIMRGIKKGSNKNLLFFDFPVAMKGVVHLRKDYTIWTYYPTLKKNLKTSFQSIVLGSIISYGDIMGSELSYDYNVFKVEEDEEHFILTLNPKPENKEAYAKILIWINKKTFLPLKRQYFSLSNMLLKEAIFEEIKFNNNKKLEFLKIKFIKETSNEISYVDRKSVV